MKPGHEGRRRTVVDVVRRADLLDLAVVQHHDAIGKLDRLILIVGDEHGGVTGAIVDVAQPAAQLAADLGVERAEGLVEEQDARLDGQRAGERDALALAAGELRGIAASPGRRAGRGRAAPSRACGSPSSPGGSPAAADVETEGDVVEHRHVAEEGVVLEDEADMALLNA